MKSYFKEQQLEVEPEKLFKLEFEHSSKKEKRKIKQEDDIDIILPLYNEKKKESYPPPLPSLLQEVAFEDS